MWTKPCIKNSAFKVLRLLLEIHGKSKTYIVEGCRKGKLTIYEDDVYIFEEATGGMKFGFWGSVDGSILIFDHYLHTMDGGRTFYSYKMNLGLIESKWDKSFKNASSRIYSAAKNVYCQVEKLDRREDQMLMRLPQKGIVAEIGVETGAFSKTILSVNKPARLHLIDAWESMPEPWPSYHEQLHNFESLTEYFRDEIKNGRISMHKGDDLQILGTFPDEYFDWVYIDTTHQYEQTLRELHACSKKVKIGGYVCGHEYSDNSISRRYGFGVIRAVDQFIRETGWSFKYLTSEDTPSFVLQR